MQPFYHHGYRHGPGYAGRVIAIDSVAHAPHSDSGMPAFKKSGFDGS